MENTRTLPPPLTELLPPLERPAPVCGRNGRLLQGYLHKTSNSLCGIKGYASLIASAEGPDHRLNGWARKIIAEVDTMVRVYHSIQEMAFPTLGEPGGRDLAGTVAAAVTEVAARFPHLLVDCASLTAGRLLLPAADLELALRELLANCGESRPAAAADSPVTVHIGTRLGAGERVQLLVADDGPGLPPEVQPSPQAPFVTTKDGHLGIGLSRVDTIMDMYGLAWSLHGVPGTGTTVVLEVAAAGQLRRRTVAPAPKG